jgi:hypothetical protein
MTIVGGMLAAVLLATAGGGIGIGESIRPRSLKGLPAHRNPVRGPGPNRAHEHYVNLAPLPTPGRGRSERV